MIIDSHHHLWDPALNDYGWMPKGDKILDRVYSLEDFEAELSTVNVDQTVLVQAAPSAAETQYLLDIADSSPRIAAVVGWIDFENPSERATLERFAQHPKFRSIRPMVQDIADDNWVLSPNIQWAFDAVEELDLAFDALGFTRHGHRFLKVLASRPDMRVVLDHCLKPEIAKTSFAESGEWAVMMKELALHTNACCKLSGLVTEAGVDVDEAILSPWVQHVLHWFGPDRVMWGSDWPVSRLRMEYSTWLEQAQSLCADLSHTERDAIFGETARHFYRIAGHKESR